MKPIPSCPKPQQLHQLVASELSDVDMEKVASHLEECLACQQAVEAQIHGTSWWQEAKDSLQGMESEADAHDEELYSNTEALGLLGPTDDPSKLGRIAGYEIIGILGRGGMGIVFKGFDPPLNRYVAIKMLLPQLAASGAARKRFAREAQAAAAVVDDHVMAIHAVAEWKGIPYLVMPYSRGTSLQRRLDANGPLTLREILRIASQTAKGLAAAHAQGLVHRDIKPANILLDDGVERVTLTDFGLARAVDDASLTRTGVLAGTPQYMSPEQTRAQAVDARSDLFSLGSVLYAMCTGSPPFRADSSYALLRMIADDEPRTIRETNPDIPEWLCKIVARLMAKNADERYATALEVAHLLESCLAHVQQPMVVPLPLELSQSELRKRVTAIWEKGWKWGAGSLVLGIFAVLLWTNPWGSVGQQPSSSPASPSQRTVANSGNQENAASQRQKRAPRPWKAPRTVIDTASDRVLERLNATEEVVFEGALPQEAIGNWLRSLDLEFEFHEASLQEQSGWEAPLKYQTSGSIRQILTRTLAIGGGGYYVREGTIVIASRDQVEASPVLRDYDLSFVLENDGLVKELEEAIRVCIEPTRWQENWGMRCFGSVLIVTAPEPVHGKIEALLFALSQSVKK